MPKTLISQRSTGTKVAFGDVVQLSRERSSDPERDGHERFVGLEHIDPSDLRIRRWGNVADGVTFTSVFRPGQVLFGKRRAYQRKVAVADFSGVCSGDIYVLEPKGNALLPELLPFICQTEAFFEHAVGTSAGSLSPRTNWESLASFEFMLPPIEEQRRIAAALRAARMAAEAGVAVLASVEVLLRSAIDATAQRGVRSQQLRPLDDLVSPDRPICYGILMPGTGFEGGVPVIKVKDYPNGHIVTKDLLLTDPKMDEEFRRSRLRAGDLLISIRGTIGRLARVPKTLDGANITQDTARLSIRPEVNVDYVRAMLESSYVQRQIATFTTGLAVQGINIGELRRVQIPLVNSSLQAELVQKVVVIRQAMSAVSARRQQALGLLCNVRESMLRETCR
jgi:type I restriction enzyme S subunit